MKICLKTSAKQAGSRTVIIQVEARRPARVRKPCELTCVIKVVDCVNYYLVTLDVSATLEIACQRCLAEFPHEHTNQAKLAVCANDEVAETLMASFECIVANDYQIDLIDILCDELHLFLPEKHSNVSECDPEMSGLIGDII